MNWTHIVSKRLTVLVAALVLAGCATMGDRSVQVRLTGDEEVPSVRTSASGTGTVTVTDDRSVSVKVTTQGVAGVAAHIHEGAAGANGPVIVPLTKTADNEWSSAPGAKLTESQYAAYKAGRTYLNVHSAANKGGEIRGQIRPSDGGGSRAY